jgi:hypothetical protein
MTFLKKWSMKTRSSTKGASLPGGWKIPNGRCVLLNASESLSPNEREAIDLTSAQSLYSHGFKFRGILYDVLGHKYFVYSEDAQLARSLWPPGLSMRRQTTWSGA